MFTENLQNIHRKPTEHFEKNTGYSQNTGNILIENQQNIHGKLLLYYQKTST